MKKTFAKPAARICATALLLCSLSTSSLAAETDAPVPANDDLSVKSIWINAGMLSHHFDRSKGFREGNIGLGFEVGLTDQFAVYGGGFRNSDDKHSNYLGGAWRPLQWGPVRAGLVAGMFDGYPRMNHGGWFPAVLPVASLEYDRVGVNFLIIPKIGDKVYSAAVLQFKLRLK